MKAMLLGLVAMLLLVILLAGCKSPCDEFKAGDILALKIDPSHLVVYVQRFGGPLAVDVYGKEVNIQCAAFRKVTP